MSEAMPARQEDSQSYRSTVWACYFSNFVGAIVINIIPIIFIPLREIFGLSYTQLGILLATNFATQILTDLIFSAPTDRYGYRPFVVLAPLLTIVGYAVFALSPLFLTDPFPGFLVGTVIFSATGGLLELLLSPIINAIPGDQKATMMSVLHSFYGWGQLTVVLVTTLLVFVLGRHMWQWIIAFWSLFPVINVFQFIFCRLPPQIPEEQRQGSRFLMKQKFFYVIVLTIAFAGMTEVSMAMWTSAFMERGLGLPKLTGDLAGMCMFAAMLASGRMIFGLFGQKIDVLKLMIAGSIAAFFLYLTVALSPWNFLALAACALCGLAVSLLWPGSVSLAGAEFPQAGAWLFAMLAAGGDSGASVGPYLVGVLADRAGKSDWLQGTANYFSSSAEQLGLRFGIFAAALFPVLTFLLLLWIRANRRNECH